MDSKTSRSWPAAVIVLLAACQQTPLNTGGPTIIPRPVHVLIDPALITCEVMAVLFAVEFWRRHGVTATVSQYVAGTGGKRGDVVVLDADIGVPGVLGFAVTVPAVSDPGRPEIWAAAIMLDSCEPQVATHELGHALGLRHRTVPGALMHPTFIGGGWDVSREELQWVTD